MKPLYKFLKEEVMKQEAMCKTNPAKALTTSHEKDIHLGEGLRASARSVLMAMGRKD